MATQLNTILRLSLDESGKAAKQNVEATPAEVSEEYSAPIDQHFANLARQVFLSTAYRRGRTVVFCGATRGSGCSSVCLKTAEALSKLVPDSVCVLDATLRPSVWPGAPGIETKYGFWDFISKGGNAMPFARRVSGKNLWLLPSSPAEDAELQLRRATLLSRMAQIESEFHYLLIDAGVLSDCPGPASFASAASGAVLVVDSESTRRDEARTTDRALRSAGLQMLGAVVNKTGWKIDR